MSVIIAIMERQLALHIKTIDVYWCLKNYRHTQNVPKTNKICFILAILNATVLLLLNSLIELLKPVPKNTHLFV